MISFAILSIRLALSMAGTPPAQCSAATQTRASLQWSESARIVAPNRAWQVEVHPVLNSDENQTPVVLQACLVPDSWPLFVLVRSAEMYWSPDSRSLLVVNEPLSGTNELLFFPVGTLSEGKEIPASNQLNNLVKQALLRRLGEARHIEFYLPRFASWKASNLVLAVGGTTSSGASGPMASYCYGFVINSSTLHMQDALSAAGLKTKFGAECRVSP